MRRETLNYKTSLFFELSMFVGWGRGVWREGEGWDEGMRQQGRRGRRWLKGKDM
jgi:hypothetical protein